MDWTEIAPFIAILGVLGAMWWRLNSRIDTLDARFATLDAKFDAKFDTLHKLLTDNLLVLNRDIGSHATFFARRQTRASPTYPETGGGVFP